MKKNVRQAPGKQHLRCGCRNSSLSRIQTESTIDEFRRFMPSVTWEIIPFSSPGDRDRKLDLRESPDDFFTRDLDDAVHSGEIDCAVHSAKDFSPKDEASNDWFWLPWREDPTDALVMRYQEQTETLGKGGVIGISSERRHTWSNTHFPNATLNPIRGNIDSRLRQLDEGLYDAVIIAVAALRRLGLSHRITKQIPLKELPTPPGQGILALSFSKGNRFFQRLRALLLPPVRFVGAGAGEAGWITVNGTRALREAEICLYDSLIDTGLLDILAPDCIRLSVGKRMGHHSFKQDEICSLITEHARRGLKVLRLKGGDPGLYGRLKEELTALDRLGMPHLVYPGLSALTLATTGTGILLTGRTLSQGFKVLTPRRGSHTAPEEELFPPEKKLPIVLFMPLSETAAIRNHFLLKEKLPSSSDCVVVYNAGGAREEIVHCTLDSLDSLPFADGRPGIILVNPPEAQGYRWNGPMEGDRVLLTCSTGLMERAYLGVEEAGGRPIPLPLIRQEPIEENLPTPYDIARYDWIILSSPAAIDIFLKAYRNQGGDYRRLPKIMVCGTASAHTLAQYGLIADLVPDLGSGAKELTAAAKTTLQSGMSILRIRSDVAGTDLTSQMTGFEIHDVILYRTVPGSMWKKPPAFEAVFFASSSAARAFESLFGLEPLVGKTILAMGAPTQKTLMAMGLSDILIASGSDARSAIQSLAIEYFQRRIVRNGISRDTFTPSSPE